MIEHGQYWLRISNLTPNAVKLSADVVAGKVEIVGESKNDTSMLQLRSHRGDPEELPPPSSQDTDSMPQ